MSEVSFYIPYIESNVSINNVQHVFENVLKLGKIKSIKLIGKQNVTTNKKFQSAYIYFKYFNNDSKTIDFLTKINNSIEMKITFLNNGNKFYWKILKNRSNNNNINTNYTNNNNPNILDLTPYLKDIDMKEIMREIAMEGKPLNDNEIPKGAVIFDLDKM